MPGPSENGIVRSCERRGAGTRYAVVPSERVKYSAKHCFVREGGGVLHLIDDDEDPPED